MKFLILDHCEQVNVFEWLVKITLLVKLINYPLKEPTNHGGFNCNFCKKTAAAHLFYMIRNKIEIFIPTLTKRENKSCVRILY